MTEKDLTEEEIFELIKIAEKFESPVTNNRKKVFDMLKSAYIHLKPNQYGVFDSSIKTPNAWNILIPSITEIGGSIRFLAVKTEDGGFVVGEIVGEINPEEL